MYRFARAGLLAGALLIALNSQGLAQDAENEAPLPPVVVEQAEERPAAAPPERQTATRKPVRTPDSAPERAGIAVESDLGSPLGTPETAGPAPTPTTRSGSLTVPTLEEAIAEINQTPGGVEIVPDSAYKDSTPSTTLKDVLNYVPGVFVQPKWGEDARLSIRGSGLSRNFHLRSIQLFMDGIPINTADGYGDFQEIDPTAYSYVEVFKGANALRYGANSLGGAINFVMPTGYTAAPFMARTDFGSFGFRKAAASASAVVGAGDYFITGTWQEADGFRQHSAGDSLRGSMNVGYRIAPNVETRFYLNASKIEQQIPGSVTKEVALTDPKQAAAINVTNDWQRNIDSVRLANKTAIRLAPDTLLELGLFGVDRHLMHPIFLWLDYRYKDYGTFARLLDERAIMGRRNLFVAGVNLHHGDIDADLYATGPGAVKGPLVQSADQRAENTSFYFENSFYFLPDVAFVAGTQYLHAVRDQEGILNTISGRNTFDLWSPKFGVLWDVDPEWQIYGNISKSGEVPSFGEGAALIPFTDIKAQTAWTYEIGTRGRRPDHTWDISLYRSEVKNELQCLGAPTDFCSVVNVPHTIHQGVELGFGYSVLKGIFADGLEPDRLWLNTAYTFNDFYFDNDPVFGDNELPGIPRHYIRSELLYKHPSGFFAGPNIEWVPEAYFVDNPNTLKTKAYALWGAKIGFERGNLSGYVEGRNLSDESYIATVNIAPQVNQGSALFWPGDGRAVYAGLQWKW